MTEAFNNRAGKPFRYEIVDDFYHLHYPHIDDIVIISAQLFEEMVDEGVFIISVQQQQVI